MNALAALNQAHNAWERSQPQYVLFDYGALEEGVDCAGGGSAAAPSSSAPSDGNPPGHPPDDQRIPASSLSAWGRGNGALDLTTSGPSAPPPKEDSGRAEGGHSK